MRDVGMRLMLVDPKTHVATSLVVEQEISHRSVMRANGEIRVVRDVKD